MTCDDCPYKEQIESNTEKLHDLDKNLGIATSTQDLKYQTIIDLLTDIKADKVKLGDRISELEKKEPLNNYKTNRASTFMESLTVPKIIAFAVSVLVLIQMMKGA